MEYVTRLYLFHGLQHALPSLPRFGVLPDAVEAGHAVPLSVLQLPVKGIGQQQHGVVNIAVGDLWNREERKHIEIKYVVMKRTLLRSHSAVMDGNKQLKKDFNTMTTQLPKYFVFKLCGAIVVFAAWLSVQRWGATITHEPVQRYR